MNLKTIERSLFARHYHEQRPVHWLRTCGQIAWLLLRDVAEGRLNLYAMSLVYSTLIAIVPLLAFAFAALKGLGICQLPDYYVFDHIQEGRLVELLPELAFRGGGVYAVYPQSRYPVPKVQALVDYLVKRFRPRPPWRVPRA